jgi:hypothetical protein
MYIGIQQEMSNVQVTANVKGERQRHPDCVGTRRTLASAVKQDNVNVNGDNHRLSGSDLEVIACLRIMRGLHRVGGLCRFMGRVDDVGGPGNYEYRARKT